MTRVKICGLSRQKDIEAVNEYLPDYIGFVFAESRRQVSDSTAIELKRGLSPAIAAVGVFVNERPERILRLCEAGAIDLVQLHGEETEKYMEDLKSRVPNKIIKAIRVKSKEDIEKAKSTCSDYLLFDAYKKDQYGGAGESFDWSMIAEINKPFFLAGGIDNGNVMRAVSQAAPYGIDVSSGVETEGCKDAAKIKELIAKIRSVG